MSSYHRIKEQLWEQNQNMLNRHSVPDCRNLCSGNEWDHLQGMHIKQMGHTGLPIPFVLQGRGQHMEQLMGILKMESAARDIKKTLQEGWNSTGN